MTYVNSLATVARGITVTINAKKIGEILDDGIPIPETETDDIEVTNQDSGAWKEYKPGRKDGGECEIKAHYIASDVGQIELISAASGTATHTFVDTYPDGSAMTFSGVVKSADISVEDEVMILTCKVKVSGEPVYSTSDSALTGMTVTGQTLKPTFDAGKFNYAIDVLTGVSSVTVVPVQAAAGASITVNGTAVASGGNGAVTLGAAGSVTDITVIVQEASKTAVGYQIHVYRA